MTDKTGTLTENIMVLKVCTIGGIQYGTFSSSGNLLRDSKAEGSSNNLTRTIGGVLGDQRMVAALDQGNTQCVNFFLCMAVNNSVVPSVHADGTRVYKVGGGDGSVCLGRKGLGVCVCVFVCV